MEKKTCAIANKTEVINIDKLAKQVVLLCLIPILQCWVQQWKMTQTTPTISKDAHRLESRRGFRLSG